MTRAPLARSAALIIAITAAAGVAACQGCQARPPPVTVDAATAGKPTVRLVILSTVAGAMEPCGCTKDQLGGIDHLAAFLEAQRPEAPNRLVLAAGPLLFIDPTVDADERTQDGWKAEAIALAAKDLGLAAWVPGVNDWALGQDALAKYRDESGATLLAANLGGVPGVEAAVVRDIGGVKIGIVGVANPKDRTGASPPGVQPAAALDAMKAGIARVKQQGAQILVGLAALPRGEALRLADAIPELHVLALGKPVQIGDANDGPKPPVLIGSTLVVETANHLQNVAVVDLFVQDAGGRSEPLVFADASGVARAEELISLGSRIRDLENRINSWERDGTISKQDLRDRKADLEKLRADKARLETAQQPVKGSFFRYKAVEIRERLGSDKAVSDRMLAYYKRVNEHNKEAFKDRIPAPPAAGQAGYIGVDACTDCHDEERAVYDKTLHARAYATLEKDFKQYNLDCASCHVTGYGKPGGSTVTHNEKLQNVQCEECHGPGSLHAKDPGKAGLILGAPKPESCISQCHHPPHVEGFDAVEKMKLVLGPGHQRE